MSTNQTFGIDAMFDLQRTAMEQTRRMFEQSLDAQQQGMQLFLRGLESTGTTREQTNAVVETAVNAYFDALAANVPGDAEAVEQLRETTMEGVQGAEEFQAESYERMVEFAEQNVEAYDEFVADYEEMLQESFETTMDAYEDVEAQTIEITEAGEAE